MNQRTLVILIASLGLLTLGALLMMPGGQQSLGEGDLLLPDMAEQLNEISDLTVRRSGGEVVATLRRETDGWVVTDRGNYPANFARIRQNLRGLSEARIFEAKTANPEFYERLGVRDISDPLATGHEFSITAPDFSARVIVGRTDEQGGKLAYVRRAEEAGSYLVRASLNPGQGANAWLENAVLDIPSTRIRSVEIKHPDGEVLGIAKPRSDSVNYTIADIPEGQSLAYEGVANAIGAAVAGLQLDDVQAAADFSAGEAQPVTARFETFDGLTLEVTTWELAEDDRRIAIRAEARSADDTAEGEPVDQESLQKIIDEAEAINRRVDGWIYTVPSFKSEQFTRRMNDMLSGESQG